MSVPMQISIPLALYLRSPVIYNFMTNERWKPGEMYQEGRSLQDFAFIDRTGSRTKATLQFAAILRCLFNHPNWPELFLFFSKRYTKREILSDREARKLTAPEDSVFNKGKKATVNFKTDPSSVGLPRDLVAQLGEACRTGRGGFLGPDTQPVAIGPAISVAMGAGAYMDLLYDGHPPGEYPWRLRPMPGTPEHTQGGGRGRTWDEWAQLWTSIADWVYEHDATSLELHFLSSHSFKYRLSDEENRQRRIGEKVPRKWLSTSAIDGADAVRDVFKQLAERPHDFQGTEWDFLELEVGPSVREAFYRRFGNKNQDKRTAVRELTRDVGVSEWNRLDYNEVSPVALKSCPSSFRGIDWENWLLSIEGGDVIVVKTIFQALWAVILLTQLPLNIRIIDKEDKFPRYRDPEEVYL